MDLPSQIYIWCFPKIPWVPKYGWKAIWLQDHHHANRLGRRIPKTSFLFWESWHLSSCFLPTCTSTKWLCWAQTSSHSRSWLSAPCSCLHASLKFWDEAFIAATYLINRTPSKVIDFDNPTERLLKQKPYYSALRVFGCACRPNHRPYNKHKLEFRSKQCVFLGYRTFHKGFKSIDVSSGCVYISGDVVFDDTEFPFSKNYIQMQELGFVRKFLFSPPTC